jgi:hypothetical protein
MIDMVIGGDHARTRQHSWACVTLAHFLIYVFSSATVSLFLYLGFLIGGQMIDYEEPGIIV